MRVLKTIDLLHDNITGLEIYQKCHYFPIIQVSIFFMKEVDFYTKDDTSYKILIKNTHHYITSY